VVRLKHPSLRKIANESESGVAKPPPLQEIRGTRSHAFSDTVIRNRHGGHGDRYYASGRGPLVGGEIVQSPKTCPRKNAGKVIDAATAM